MRFEAQHQHLQRLSKAVKNYKLIVYTLASRFQYHQCILFHERPTRSEFVGTSLSIIKNAKVLGIVASQCMHRVLIQKQLMALSRQIKMRVLAL